MIGQTAFKNEVQNLIDRGKFPHFSIIVGEKGSGKKEAAKEIAARLGVQCVLWDNSMDGVRGMLKYMGEQQEPILFIIPDYEDMNYRTPGALLKVCEETPEHAYIVLTAQSKESILNTILNRGYLFELVGYSKEELAEYMATITDVSESKLLLCSVPGDIQKVVSMNESEFVAFCDKFFDNIGVANPGNALKVTKQLKLKDGEGYDIKLFINLLFNKTKQVKDAEVRSKIYDEIIKAKTALRRGYNPAFIVDTLILGLRDAKYGIV